MENKLNIPKMTGTKSYKKFNILLDFTEYAKVLHTCSALYKIHENLNEVGLEGCIVYLHSAYHW